MCVYMCPCVRVSVSQRQSRGTDKISEERMQAGFAESCARRCDRRCLCLFVGYKHQGYLECIMDGTRFVASLNFHSHLLSDVGIAFFCFFNWFLFVLCILEYTLPQCALTHSPSFYLFIVISLFFYPEPHIILLLSPR